MCAKYMQQGSQIRERSAAFYDAGYARRKEALAELPKRDADIPKRIRQLAKSNQFSLLDIGCGWGKVAYVVRGLFPEARVCGIDLAPEAIEKARSFYPDIDFRLSDELNLPFGDHSFDYATCRMSFHHYPDVLAHLSEVKRILRPGGTYLVMDIVPEEGEMDICLNRIFSKAEQIAPGDGHVKFYTLAEYRGFFSETGYEAEGIEYSDFPVKWPKGRNYFDAIFEGFLASPGTFRSEMDFVDNRDSFSYTMRMAGIFAHRKNREHITTASTRTWVRRAAPHPRR